MATDHNIKNFNAADIEKYHRGLLSAKERHALEKAALDDPFLADAIEGYAVAGVNVSADIDELRKRLAEKTEDKKVIAIGASNKRSFPTWRAAAAVLLIGSAGYLTYQFAFTKRQNESIANTDIKKVQQQPLNGDTTTTIASIPGMNGNAEGATNDTNRLVTSNNGNTTTRQLVGATSPQGFSNAPVAQYKNDSISRGDVNASLISPAREEIKDNKTSEAVANNTVPKPSAAAGDKELADEMNKRKQVAKDAEAEKLGEIARNEEARSRRNANGYVQQYKPNIFRGRVTDNFNNGIPFANVTNTQDNVGTYTDARGYFNLTSPDSVLNVQTRALGFNNYNIQLRNSVPDNRVVMQEDQSIAAQTLTNKKVNSERRSKTDPNFTFEGEPEPEDSWEAYDSYLANNVNIPKEFKSGQPDGSSVVEISFEVNKNGDPVNFKVEKSLCDKCDKEAIRLIKEGPKWKRKARKGRTTVAIAF